MWLQPPLFSIAALSLGHSIQVEGGGRWKIEKERKGRREREREGNGVTVKVDTIYSQAVMCCLRGNLLFQKSLYT